MTLPLTLYIAPQAFRLDPEQPIGREAAGAGFLEAYLRFGGNRRHHLIVSHISHGEWFQSEAVKYQTNPETIISGMDEWGTISSATGALVLPGPGIDEWAWKRMPIGDGKFSLIGLVHTLCSKQVQWGLGQFNTAPIRSWDALICTSKAARAVVEGFLERQESWLYKKLGATSFERPQLPVIPLGVHCEAWTPKNDKQTAQAKARKLLGIDTNALVVLVSGRLDILTKFHPGPLLRVLADLQQNELPELELLIYGEAPNPGMAELWHKGLTTVAPSLVVHWVAGKQTELASTVRWAADLFISLADNPQETFGMTPLEAMAAEVPCLVSDWDGYRDTVTDDVGIRISTQLFDGLGREEAQGLLKDTLQYDMAIGRISQGIAVNTKELRNACLKLLSNKQLRIKLGKNGRKRVEQYYSWEIIISQWRKLLQELELRRLAAVKSGDTNSPQEPPWLPTASEAFGEFASIVIKNDQKLYWTSPNSKSLAAKLLKEPFDSWDIDLSNKLIDGHDLAPHQLPERLKGWLIKQGLLSYQEFFYNTRDSDTDFDSEFQDDMDWHESARIFLKNANPLLMLQASDWNITPTQFQRSTFPSEWHPSISVIHDGIDTDLAAPDQYINPLVLPDKTVLSYGQDVITFVNRSIEPYRGCHSFIRSIPDLLLQNPQAHIVIVGEAEGVSYGKAAPGNCWRDVFLNEIKGTYNSNLVHFVGSLSYSDFLHLLKLSACHVYLTYPFVLSWSLLEAMSTGVPIVGSKTKPVEEVIRHGQNGLLVDFFSTESIVNAVSILLKDRCFARQLGHSSRIDVLRKYSIRDCVPRHLALMDLVATGALK